MLDQGIIILCIIAMVIVFLLVQLFLSSRSSFIWGLFMPAFLLMMGLYVALDMDFLSFLPIKIQLNQIGHNLYIIIGIGGMLVSLAILVACRIWKKKRALRKEQEREARRLEHQHRLAAEAAWRADGMISSHVLTDQQRVEEARRQADLASAQREKELAEQRARKQQARSQHHQTVDAQKHDLEQTLIYPRTADIEEKNDLAFEAKEHDDANFQAARPQEANTEQLEAFNTSAVTTSTQENIAANDQNDAGAANTVATKPVAADIARRLSAGCQNGAKKVAAALKTTGQQIAVLCRRGANGIQTTLLPKIKEAKVRIVTKAQQIKEAQADARAAKETEQSAAVEPDELSQPADSGPQTIRDEEVTIDEINDEQDGKQNEQEQKE